MLVKSKTLFLQAKNKMLFLHFNIESRSFPFNTTKRDASPNEGLRDNLIAKYPSDKKETITQIIAKYE